MATDIILYLGYVIFALTISGRKWGTMTDKEYALHKLRESDIYLDEVMVNLIRYAEERKQIENIILRMKETKQEEA